MVITIFLAIDQDTEPSIILKLRPHLEIVTSVHLCPTSILITATILVFPSVPSRLGMAPATDFNYVELHACWTRPIVTSLDITIISTSRVAIFWGDGVKIHIDAVLCLRFVHVELDVSTRKVECRFAIHSTTTC